MQPDHALQLAGGAHLLDARALDPRPVAPLVFHPKLDVEGANARRDLASDFVRRRTGVVGMNELVPGFECVRQLRDGIAEHFLPGRRKIDAARRELEIEEAGWTMLAQQLEGRGAGIVGSGDRGQRGRRRLHGGDVAQRGARDFFEAHQHFARRGLAGLDVQDSRAVERAREHDHPLHFEKLRIVRNHLEGEERREGLAGEFVFTGLPEAAGRGVGRDDPAGRIEDHDGAETGEKIRAGRPTGTVL